MKKNCMTQNNSFGQSIKHEYIVYGLTLIFVKNGFMLLKNQMKKGLRWELPSTFFILKTVLAVYLLTSLTSCITYKDIVNFQDGQDLKDGKLDSIVNFTKWTVQPEDILQVNVYSSNIAEASRFNVMDIRTNMQMQQAGGGNTEPIGYRVTTDGYIDMPVIGRVKAAGLTLEQIKIQVEEKVNATRYLPDVNVQVLFMSFRITILGEVNAPRSYIIRTEQMNILEAIGMAGDLTLFSNRKNILIVREKGGVRSYGRVDVTSRDLFQSPYFYLQPNDVVYIQPHKAKIMAAPDPASRYLSTVVGVISLFTLIFSLTK